MCIGRDNFEQWMRTTMGTGIDNCMLLLYMTTHILCVRASGRRLAKRRLIQIRILTQQLLSKQQTLM